MNDLLNWGKRGLSPFFRAVGSAALEPTYGWGCSWNTRLGCFAVFVARHKRSGADKDKQPCRMGMPRLFFARQQSMMVVP